jgi:3-dehydroquinate dehydratase type I
VICAVLLSSDIEDLQEQIQKTNEEKIDLIEIRLDGFLEINLLDLQNLLSTLSIPYIISLRSEWYNTHIEPPNEGRQSILKEIIPLGPPYIELEYPMDVPLIKLLGEETVPILSMNDYEGMAKIAFDAISNLYDSTDHQIIFKILATPNTVGDLKQLWRWAKKLNKRNIKHIIIGMGKLGKVSRYKSRELTNFWTYGKLDHDTGETFQPGMVTVENLQDAFSDESWHLGALQGVDDGKKELVFGNYIKHAKLNGVFTNIDISSSPELDQMLLWIKDGLLDGVYIDHPWQSSVTSRLDIKDASVHHTSVCNTVVYTESGLKGYNTYVEALDKILSKYYSEIKRVYIVGSDFLVRSALTVLKNQVDAIIVRESNLAIYDQLKTEFPMIEMARDSYYEEYDLIINCSIPERGFENVLPVSSKILKKAKLIFDPLSKPSKHSPLIKYGFKNNISTLDGWKYYLHSLSLSFKLWTGKNVNFKQIPVLNTIEEYIDMYEVFCCNLIL